MSLRQTVRSGFWGRIHFKCCEINPCFPIVSAFLQFKLKLTQVCYPLNRILKGFLNLRTNDAQGISQAIGFESEVTIEDKSITIGMGRILGWWIYVLHVDDHWRLESQQIELATRITNKGIWRLPNILSKISFMLQISCVKFHCNALRRLQTIRDFGSLDNMPSLVWE